jgi:hypothetical protein
VGRAYLLVSHEPIVVPPVTIGNDEKDVRVPRRLREHGKKKPLRMTGNRRREVNF